MERCVEHVECWITRSLLVMLPTLTNNLRLPLSVYVSGIATVKALSGGSLILSDDLGSISERRIKVRGFNLPASTHLSSRKVMRPSRLRSNRSHPKVSGSSE
jgi:hypothetical protein